VSRDDEEGVIRRQNRPTRAGSPKDSAAKSHPLKPPSRTGRAQ
jgi:hypothetical protein